MERRAAAAFLTLTLLAAVPTPAAAAVDVGNDLHGYYDACIAKFTAAGKRDLVDQLDRSKHVFKIRKSVGTVSNPASKEDAEDAASGTGGETLWHPTDSSSFPGQDPCSTLYHEMSHLADYDKGLNRRDNCFYLVNGKEMDTGLSVGEVKATRKENEYRATQPGLDARDRYGANVLPPPGTECLPRKPDPPPRGCSVGCAIGAGDPHLRTLDQVHYDFQAVGEFVLTRALSGDLEVHGRQSAVRGLRTVSVYSAVAANVAGDRVGVYRVPGGLQLRIGGAVAESATTRTLPHGGAVEEYAGGELEIRWPDGSALRAVSVGTASMRVSLHLIDARRGTVEGLFGNFDGKAEGDLAVRGGAALGEKPSFESLYTTFADSWRVTQAESLFDYGPGESTETFTDRSFPDRPASAADLPNRASADAICRAAGVTEPATLEGCILDVGLTGEAAFAVDAAATQELVAGATTLSISQPGGRAQLIFTGTAGQKVFVDVSESTLPDQCGVLTLLDPASGAIASGCIINGKGHVDGTVLPATGQYALVLNPSTGSTGESRVRVITAVDQELAVTPDGPEVSPTVAQPGGVSRLHFAGTAGQKVFVDVSDSTLPDQCGVLTLLDPASRVIASGCIINGKGYVDGTVLQTTGQYTAVVDPAERGLGVSRVRLVNVVDQGGTIAVDGPEVTATIGQAGAVTSLRFSGTAGQKVIVDVPSSSLPDQCGVLRLLDRAERVIVSGCIINGKGVLESALLPETGEYTVVVDPDDRATGTARVRLRRSVTM